MKAVSVGTSKVGLVEQNADRTALLLANPDATAILYIGDEEKLSTSNGFPLFPQTYIMLGIGEGVDVRKKLWVIADTAGKNCRVLEYFLRVAALPPVGKPGFTDPRFSWTFGKVMAGL